MYYENIFRALGKDNIRYVVAGGIALVLHGVVRLTADLDLIVDLERDNLKRFIQAMNDLGYRPRNPIEAVAMLDPVQRDQWRREKGMTVFSFVDPAQPMGLVDVFIEENIPFPEIMQNRVVMTAKDITISVISRSHLKRLKQEAGRPQDLADIEAIEELEKQEKKER
ncbi:MAG TPA: hypothetical protein VN604_06520 [Nitrospirota bacterium]|nr:hypothetical protein [Nitrospirota bacterium]